MIKIVTTIGPASGDPKTISEMIKAGADIARLNFSHGDHKSHAKFIKNIRTANKKIPILQDLSGPRVQTGKTHSFKKGSKTFTQKDKKDLLFGLEQKIDLVALSDVKDKGDILRIREFLKKHKSKMPIIAKIETKEALRNIKSIIKVSDMIMVARGDLAASIPMEKVPFAQKTIVELSNDAGKPVIVATEMLKSMVTEAAPTRAEITDVANAILDGADMIMLSEETTIGKDPVNVVKTMHKIAKEAQMYPVTYDI
ncbi:MAG: pyruvate kinase [Candidatus Paceibacteria bacterium]